eukprot:5088535-Alexandrium_andersonii.AAC.1
MNTALLQTRAEAAAVPVCRPNGPLRGSESAEARDPGLRYRAQDAPRASRDGFADSENIHKQKYR